MGKEIDGRGADRHGDGRVVTEKGFHDAKKYSRVEEGRKEESEGQRFAGVTDTPTSKDDMA